MYRVVIIGYVGITETGIPRMPHPTNSDHRRIGRIKERRTEPLAVWHKLGRTAAMRIHQIVIRHAGQTKVIIEIAGSKPFTIASRPGTMKLWIQAAVAVARH